MAKRELAGNLGTPLPFVVLNKKAGVTFTGKFLGMSTGKIGKSYRFAIQDGDAPIKIGNKKDGYKDVDVSLGDTVVVYGNNQIDSKLDGVKVGEVIEIVYNGKKFNERTDREYNDYTIAVIED